MLMFGLFLIAGGAYALFREFFLQDAFRLGWAISNALVFSAGVTFWLIADKSLATKEAYFSMNPERIKYRLTLFAREQAVHWKEVDAVDISVHSVVFNLTSGKSVTMRLGNIQQPEIILHVSRSIHLAAMEKGIMVNGVQTVQQSSVA
ncbi:hypothetical protein GCM10027293_13820 [Pontibacter aydingkolensis]